MIVAYQETTQWTTNVKNHTYLINDEDDRLYGYVVDGQQIVLKKPMQFSRTGRTFKRLNDQSLVGIINVESKKSTLIEVKGSKGNVYYIDPVKRTCTCPGYKFRNTCRHLTEFAS